MSRPGKDRTGQRHGLVVVLGPWTGPIPVGVRQPCWEVRCDCGVVRQPPKTHIACNRAKARAKGLPT